MAFQRPLLSWDNDSTLSQGLGEFASPDDVMGNVCESERTGCGIDPRAHRWIEQGRMRQFGRSSDGVGAGCP